MKKFAGSILFLACLYFAFYVINTTLSFKYEDGVLQIQDLYAFEEDSVDVLFLGSSHMGTNIDPTALYEEYGLAAYSMWSASQPTWNSYYYLKEALKTQSPKLVVLECYVVVQDNESTAYSPLVKATSGLRYSKDRAEAIHVSADEKTWNENGTDLILGFPAYHSRYTDLGEVDFSRYFWNYTYYDKSVSSWGTTACSAPDLSGCTQVRELNAKHEEYLYKIIELCRANGCELLLYTSPYMLSQKEQERNNRLAQIAEGEGLTYKNLNLSYEDFNLDFTSDFADSLGHMNDRGIRKITNYMGQYIRQHYELPESYDQKLFLARPPEGLLYKLPEAFTGDGSAACVDSQIKLYDTAERSYTLVADVQPRCLSADQVFFSCFNEKEGEYGGLLVRREGDDLVIIIGNNYPLRIAVTDENSMRIAIVKNGTAYTVYTDRGVVLEGLELGSETVYDGNLLIGCQQDAEGRIFRFSATTVNALEVYDEVWTQSRIQNWLLVQQEDVYARQEETLRERYDGTVAYTLEEGFSGDGSRGYIDTGSQLFMDPQRDWSVAVEFNTYSESENRVIFSCFNEKAYENRGLMLRIEDGLLDIAYGENLHLTIALNNQSRDWAKMVFVKTGNTLSVYYNAVCVAQGLDISCEPYIGTTILGAEMTGSYTIFRHSAVKISRFQIFEEALDLESALAW